MATLSTEMPTKCLTTSLDAITPSKVYTCTLHFTIYTLHVYTCTHNYTEPLDVHIYDMHVHCKLQYGFNTTFTPSSEHFTCRIVQLRRVASSRRLPKVWRVERPLSAEPGPAHRTRPAPDTGGGVQWLHQEDGDIQKGELA